MCVHALRKRRMYVCGCVCVPVSCEPQLSCYLEVLLHSE